MLDVYTRESVAIEVGQRLKGDDVVRVFNRMKQQRGVLKVLFCDNGSEFTSQAMDLWAYQNGMKIDFSNDTIALRPNGKNPHSEKPRNQDTSTQLPTLAPKASQEQLEDPLRTGKGSLPAIFYLRLVISP
jgi:Integrase core domain